MLNFVTSDFQRTEKDRKKVCRNRNFGNLDNGVFVVMLKKNLRMCVCELKTCKGYLYHLKDVRKRCGYLFGAPACM